MRYAIVIERVENNYSAYVPDLPGCVATGGTVEEVESQIRDFVKMVLSSRNHQASSNTSKSRPNPSLC